MRRCYTAVGVVLAALAVFAMRSPVPSASQSRVREVSPLQLQQQFPVPGVAGRIDHFTGDAKRHLLIFSALGNDTVEITSTFKSTVVHSLKGLSEPQSPLYVPGFDKIFVAMAGDRSVKVFDGETYALRNSIELGEDPDNVRWDEESKRVFVGYGEDGTGAIATIDPATEMKLGKDLKTSGGHPESFQLEKKGARIFVNVPDDGNVVEVLDRRGGPLVKWGLNGAKANYAMALDEDNHRLFTITRKPPLMIVLDTEAGKEVARLPAAGGCDDVFFDSGRKRIYIIGAQGFITVYQGNDPNHYELIENIPTMIGVRTGYFFTSQDRFYVGVPAKGIEPAQVWGYEAED